MYLFVSSLSTGLKLKIKIWIFMLNKWNEMKWKEWIIKIITYIIMEHWWIMNKEWIWIMSKTIEVFSLIYKFWDTDCISFVWFYIRFIIYYACVCVCVFCFRSKTVFLMFNYNNITFRFVCSRFSAFSCLFFCFQSIVSN